MLYLYIGLGFFCLCAFILIYEIKHAQEVDPNIPFLHGDVSIEEFEKNNKQNEC